MLFTDLQNAVRDRLLADTWFSDENNGVPVLSEDREDLEIEAKKAINRLGTTAIVGEYSVRRGDHTVNEVVVSIPITFAEAVKSNRNRENPKTAKQAGERALAQLIGWSPDEAIWTKLEVIRLEPEGEAQTNEGTFVLWTLEVQTITDLNSQPDP